MTGQNVMECGCGDLRPLGQMYLRCTGNAGADVTHVVECVDCALSAGADIAMWPTLSGLFGAPPAARVPIDETASEAEQTDEDVHRIEPTPNPVKNVEGRLDSSYDGPQQVYRGRVFSAELEFLVSDRDAGDEQVEEAFRFAIGANSVLPADNPLRDSDFDIVDAEIEPTGCERWEFWNARGEDCEPGRRIGRSVTVRVGENPGFTYTPPQTGTV